MNNLWKIWQPIRGRLWQCERVEGIPFYPVSISFCFNFFGKKINLSGYFEIVYIRHGERNSKISSPFKIYPLFLHFYFQTVAITRRDCLKGDLCSAHGKYKQLILTLVFTRLLSWYNYFRLNIGLEIIWNQLRILQHAASFFLLGPPTRFFPLSRSLKTFSILIKKETWKILSSYVGYFLLKMFLLLHFRTHMIICCYPPLNLLSESLFLKNTLRGYLPSYA